ncbi:MAG TPA: PorV/PorQ family protein [bacterium]|nr:PorV/PorQ family protein [bacterium]
MKTRWLIFVVLLTAVAAMAAEEDAGTACFPFLRLGVGARSLALGEAFVADARDAEAAVLNPALLSKNRRHAVTFTHDEYLADLTFEFGAYAFPVAGGEAGSIAVAARYISYGTLQGYDEYGVPTAEFPAADLAAGVSYGIELFQGFGAGATVNYIYSRIDDVNTSTVAFDLGLSYQPLNALRLGFTAANLGPDVKYVSLESPLPVTLRLGAAGDVLDLPRHRVTLFADGVYPVYAKPYGAFGLEYTMFDLVSFRGGYRLGHDTATFSFGVGFQFALWESVLLNLDYAYADYGDLDATHLFTLGLLI